MNCLMLCRYCFQLTLVVAIGFLAFCPLIAAEESGLVLHDGDRVVFLGDGLIEQEQYHGWVEVMLTTSFPESSVTFRNLGWSADTPRGDSRLGLSLLRAGQEEPGEGWRQLVKQLELTKPTVVIIGYGMANALKNPDPSSFIADYERMILKIHEISPGARTILLSPMAPHGPSALTKEIVHAYRIAINNLATKMSSPFVDLTGVALESERRKDAIHLNDQGYRSVAEAIGKALNVPQSSWPTSPQTQSLRELILQKNQYWFHRSRPANMAYVFGFRKHEQGQNAVEIPQFDGLIQEIESVIAKRRSLGLTDLESPKPRIESEYAKFKTQPHPKFTVADELEITLWAENPMLNKPIQINFDPAGRLWVASSQTYPMIEVGQATADKIIVLEDTTGDGKADKSTVFADGLLIPTGVLPGDGGVYVAQSTDLLFLKDTDGDGKADIKRRVLSGFGTEDTHHNLHTLVWGPDGRLYMNQSVYTRSDLETPHGVVRLRAGGGFRFSTQSMRTQIFFRGLWNAWGHQFDLEGRSLMTDGAGFNGLAYVFPGATINPTPRARFQLDLISPGRYPKFCSAEIVYGNTFPESWQGSVVTCDFRANRITRFSLDDKDAGLISEQQDDLVRTGQSSFRPIDIKQGPDGALYVADWSNPIINHGEVDFRDPRRDRWHGRIWRISPKANPRVATNLYETPIERLFENLLSDDRYQVDQSRRVLIERPEATRKSLPTWLAAQTDDRARLQGLWLCQAIGSRDLELLNAMLKSDIPAVRAAAVRVLGDWSDPKTDLVQPILDVTSMDWYRELVHDSSPRVRLEAVCALTSQHSTDAIELALQTINHPLDRFIEHALHLAVLQEPAKLITRIGQPKWLTASEHRQAQLEFVLSTVDPQDAREFLSQHIDANGIASDGAGPWIELIATAGGKTELATLYQMIVEKRFDSPSKLRALDSLVLAQNRRKLRPESLDNPARRLSELLRDPDTAIQSATLDLIGVWRLATAVVEVNSIANDSKRPESIRRVATRTLGKIGGPKSETALESLAQSSEHVSIRHLAVQSLSRINFDRALPLFFEKLSETTQESDAVSLWRSMLSPKDAVRKVVAALPDSLPKPIALAGIRASQEGGRTQQSLVDALMPMTGRTMTAADWTPEKIKEVAKLVTSQGDPYRGEQIYRRENLQCSKCHSIGGVGGQVGPDLTSLGASAPLDYLIESMFDPNAKIKENYHSVILLTSDGRIVTGINAGSTEEEFVLRDASGEILRIPADDVDEQTDGKSLMPSGLLDRIVQKDQVDLICFLSHLGKPGEFDASRQNVARSLELYAGTHRTEQNGNEKLVAGEVTEGWQPLSTQVNGKVSKSTIAPMTVQPIHTALVAVYLRTSIESNGGKATLKVNGSDATTLWIDGKPVEGEPSTASGTVAFHANLPAGRHTVLVRLDARELPEQLAIASDDVTFVSKE